MAEEGATSGLRMLASRPGGGRLVPDAQDVDIPTISFLGSGRVEDLAA